jgi:hypothetical protein
VNIDRDRDRARERERERERKREKKRQLERRAYENSVIVSPKRKLPGGGGR